MEFGVWWTVIDIGHALFPSVYFRIRFSSVLFESMILTSPLSHTPPLDSILSLSLSLPLWLYCSCWWHISVGTGSVRFHKPLKKRREKERRVRVRKSKAVVVMTCIWSAGVKPERASSVLMTSASPPSILPLKQTLSSQSESKREGGRWERESQRC